MLNGKIKSQREKIINKMPKQSWWDGKNKGNSKLNHSTRKVYLKIKTMALSKERKNLSAGGEKMTSKKNQNIRFGIYNHHKNMLTWKMYLLL